jgi:hypothetical protein
MARPENIRLSKIAEITSTTKKTCQLKYTCGPEEMTITGSIISQTSNLPANAYHNPNVIIYFMQDPLLPLHNTSILDIRKLKRMQSCTNEELSLILTGVGSEDSSANMLSFIDCNAKNPIGSVYTIREKTCTRITNNTMFPIMMYNRTIYRIHAEPVVQSWIVKDVLTLYRARLSKFLEQLPFPDKTYLPVTLELYMNMDNDKVKKIQTTRLLNHTCNTLPESNIIYRLIVGKYIRTALRIGKKQTIERKIDKLYEIAKAIRHVIIHFVITPREVLKKSKIFEPKILTTIFSFLIIRDPLPNFNEYM